MTVIVAGVVDSAKVPATVGVMLKVAEVVETVRVASVAETGFSAEIKMTDGTKIAKIAAVLAKNAREGDFV